MQLPKYSAVAATIVIAFANAAGQAATKDIVDTAVGAGSFQTWPHCGHFIYAGPRARGFL